MEKFSKKYKISDTIFTQELPNKKILNFYKKSYHDELASEYSIVSCSYG